MNTSAHKDRSTNTGSPEWVTEWMEKLCFKMHWYAWHGIRWSLKRRMRSMGYDLRKLASGWENVYFMDHENKLYMAGCAEDLAMARRLIKEQHLATLASKQPYLVHEWLARDQKKAHEMVKRAMCMAQDALHMEKETGKLLDEIKDMVASLQKVHHPASPYKSSDTQTKKPPVLATPRASSSTFTNPR
jgi:hypothetical protein